jgi:hypothetical protein
MKLQGDSIPDRMVISLKGKGALYKGDLMMLEMIANANWERPIYVATTVGSENYMNLGDNFVQEGLANRITPFTTNVNGREVKGMTSFDTDKTYDNVMNRFKFGGANTPGIYLDETVMRMCYTHRRLMSQLALRLTQEAQFATLNGNDALAAEKIKKAALVLERVEKEFPQSNVPHDYQSGSLDIVRALIAINKKDKAKELIDILWNKSEQYFKYYCSQAPAQFKASQRDCVYHLYLMSNIADMVNNIDEKLGKNYDQKLLEYENIYKSRGGQF